MAKHVAEMTSAQLDALARAAWARAADDSRRQGLPVTCVEDGTVWRLWPDGRRECIAPEGIDNPEVGARRARA